MTGESVHMGDLLSAYADGELTEAERAAVDAHLPACPACRQELEATRRVKAWVADLPPVDSPFGFFERMLLDPSGPRRGRDRWVIRAGAVSLAATASIWLGVVGLTGLTGNRPGGLPALNSLVSIHQESTPADDPAADPAADHADQQQIEQAAAALGLPPSMGAYHLQSLTDAGQPQQATYISDDQILSAFVFEGYDILERRLPAGSEGWLL
ncbi:MAG TPA: zf-HC2 domain-containing protein, partial [Acidimicrobiales bacterium]